MSDNFNSKDLQKILSLYRHHGSLWNDHLQLSKKHKTSREDVKRIRSEFMDAIIKLQKDVIQDDVYKLNF
jgi:hypothetical protein